MVVMANEFFRMIWEIVEHRKNTRYAGLGP